MTKSKKAKQKRQADFKKPKIKLGKKLKAPMNETKTDFKTRKIILRDQLPQKDAEFSQKLPNLRDALSHMRHHNINVRKEGMNNLKTVISSKLVRDLLPHLSAIVHAVSAAFCDPDKLIRAGSLKQIELLFDKLDVYFDPYFHILVSHLICALVSMNRGIQTDSYALMKMLIKKKPSLLMKHSDTLLPKFLSLIAIKASHSQLGNQKDHSKQTYSFRFSPENSSYPLNERVKILKTLSLYLDTFITEKTKNNVFLSPSSNWQIIMEGCLPFEQDTRALLRQEDTFLNQRNEVKSFLESVSPLLLHTWLEVRASQANEGEVKSLSGVFYEILGCIIHILLQIDKIGEINSDEESFENAWVKQLKDPISKMLEYFPFEPAVDSTDENKRDFSIHDLNIGIALIALQLSLYNSNILSKLPQYLIDLFVGDSFDGPYKLENAIRLSAYVVKDSKWGKKTRVNVLSASFECYKRSSKKSKLLFKNLFVCVLDWDCEDIWCMTSFKKWIDEISSNRNSEDDQTLKDILQQIKLRNLLSIVRSKELTKPGIVRSKKLANPVKRDKGNIYEASDAWK